VKATDVYIILEKATGINRQLLALQLNINLNTKQFSIFVEYLYRRSQKEPLAKITEKKEFYGLLFKTTKDTLDPRPETELIIDQFFCEFCDKNAKLNILDLGCGTGCLGITLGYFYINSTVVFADISKEALSIAKYNSQNHGIFERSSFLISNWFSNIDIEFDAIVCNPPYVSTEYPIDKETLFDPYIALFAGKDGLESYRAILPQASQHLKDHGFLFLEIGFDQAEAIKTIPTELKLIKLAKDLRTINRMVTFSKI
jgi:release factor glutamine methyltransferase